MVFHVKADSVRNQTQFKKELIFLFFPVIFMLILLVGILLVIHSDIWYVENAIAKLIDSIQMIVYKLVCMQCKSLQILLYRLQYYDKSCKSCSKTDDAGQEFTA